MEANLEKKRKHFDLKSVETYVRLKNYPPDLNNSGDKANFRRGMYVNFILNILIYY